MQERKDLKPIMNDTHRMILDDATSGLFGTIWQELTESFTEKRMRQAKNKCHHLDIFGYLVKESYQVDKFSKEEFIGDLNEICSLIYKGKEFSQTPLYMAVLGLRQIWEGDQEYLTRKGKDGGKVQLSSIGGPLPTGEEIRALLNSKMESITTALIQVKTQKDYKDDYKAQVKYVTDILNKDYIFDLEGNVIQQQK